MPDLELRTRNRDILITALKKKISLADSWGKNLESIKFQ